MVGTHSIFVRGDDPRVDKGFVRISDDAELSPFLVLPRQPEVTAAMPNYDAEMAVGPGGEIYVTPGSEYHVLRYAADGQIRWALRASQSRAA